MEETIVEEINENVPSKMEYIPKEEMDQIKALQNKRDMLSLQVDKFKALLESSELSFENTLLKIYNKYNLKVGIDQILESGKIEYKE
jgi:hypothetical protein